MTKIAIAVLVATHLAIALWHGNAHTALAVALSPEQNAFVFLVILIAPVVAAVLLWTRYVSALYGAFCLGLRSAWLHRTGTA